MPESTSSAAVYRKGVNWVFYNEGHNIRYKRFADGKVASTVNLDVKGTPVRSAGGALAATLHDSSIRVYYIDEHRVIREVGLDSDSDDDWWYGLGANNEMFKTAKTSTLDALGSQEIGSGTFAALRVYYNSADDPDMVSLVYKESWSTSIWKNKLIDGN